MLYYHILLKKSFKTIQMRPFISEQIPKERSLDHHKKKRVREQRPNEKMS